MRRGLPSVELVGRDALPTTPSATGVTAVVWAASLTVVSGGAEDRALRAVPGGLCFGEVDVALTAGLPMPLSAWVVVTYHSPADGDAEASVGRAVLCFALSIVMLSSAAEVAPITPLPRSRKHTGDTTRGSSRDPAAVASFGHCLLNAATAAETEPWCTGRFAPPLPPAAVGDGEVEVGCVFGGRPPFCCAARADRRPPLPPVADGTRRKKSMLASVSAVLAGVPLPVRSRPLPPEVSPSRLGPRPFVARRRSKVAMSREAEVQLAPTAAPPPLVRTALWPRLCVTKAPDHTVSEDSGVCVGGMLEAGDMPRASGIGDSRPERGVAGLGHGREWNCWLIV